MSALDFLFPRHCHICDAPLTQVESYVCSTCLARLPRTNYHRMPMNFMEQRFLGLVPFQRAAGHFFYSREGELSTLIQDFKYRHFGGLARRMGRLMGDELIITGFLSDIDLIVPVPMHWLKKGKRGYNQTEKIARGLSEATGINMSLELKAVRGHRTQTSLSREQRLANTAGIFLAPHPERLHGRHILLLDDVCTTGATLSEAARALLNAVPDCRVSFLTLGVTF